MQRLLRYLCGWKNYMLATVSHSIRDVRCFPHREITCIRRFPDPQSPVMGFQKAWKAGEQVFISYGARTNDLLLQRYGFIEPDNPNDVYRITGLIDKVSIM